MAHPEYERTNVLGTRNVLKLAAQVGIERFVFASSLAACRFPAPGAVVDEDSPCDAGFAYARSKRAGEELVREHAEQFPGTIVRMAAMFSDWCEYPPLYVFLRTWLSRDWNARILGGRGRSAVPYLHVDDLVDLFERIVDQRQVLPRMTVVNASPSHCTSHRELFEAATHAYFGETVEPQLVPRPLAALGVNLRWWLGKLRGQPPFEAPWMVRYIDRQLAVDADRSQARLGWRPRARLDVTRRLLLMVENMKSRREVWRERNEAALNRVAERPNLVIADALDELREDTVVAIASEIGDPRHAGRYCNYHDLDPQVLTSFVRLFYQVVVTAVRSRDRQLLRHYAQILAMRRRDEGFAVVQVQAFLTRVGELVVSALRGHPRLEGREQAIHDYVQLGFQLAVDGAEDAYEASERRALEVRGPLQGLTVPSSAGELERLVQQLEDICGEGLLPPAEH
jgi:nucleoside-diphosphate-sugar epimerase